ncbi:MAG: Trm112 family protein [Gammaproteobacteria bacterium]|nr:Trm112 family protein [Gammaproteobacteria bacterium]
MDKKLLEILACPICKGKLVYDQGKQILVCRYDNLAYPIRNGIPIMLEDQAEVIKPE